MTMDPVSFKMIFVFDSLTLVCTCAITTKTKLYVMYEAVAGSFHQILQITLLGILLITA